MNFVAKIQNAVLVISGLLESKNVSDVLEAIQFFVVGFHYGLSYSMLGMHRMLALVWSKEPTVKDTVVSACQQIFIYRVQATNPRSVWHMLCSNTLNSGEWVDCGFISAR